MMPFDYTVHRPIKGEHGDGEGFTVTPYIQISGEAGSFLLRGGKFWSADGSEISDDDVPDWVWHIVYKMTPEGRVSVGFEADLKDPNAPIVAAKPAAANAPAPKEKK